MWFAPEVERVRGLLGRWVTEVALSSVVGSYSKYGDGKEELKAVHPYQDWRKERNEAVKWRDWIERESRGEFELVRSKDCGLGVD